MIASLMAVVPRVASFVVAASQDKMLHGLNLLVLSLKDSDLVG